MKEPILYGIVLGLTFITILGLFVDAYQQNRRSNQLLSKMENASEKQREKVRVG
jgi:hypothetical protein